MRVAMILLRRPQSPDPRAIVEAFEAREVERLQWREATDTGRDTPSFEFADGQLVHVALMRAPVPNEEAHAAADHSVGPQREDGLEHAAHFVIVLQSVEGAPPVDQLLRWTRFLAAVVAVSDAVGVYWGDARATHDPEFFVSVAGETELPIPLWTGVSVSAQGDERVSLLSLGMRRQLGLPDLLMTAPMSDVELAFGFFFELLAYSIERGEAVPAGETVGRDGDQRLIVRHRASPLRADETVWCVDLP